MLKVVQGRLSEYYNHFDDYDYYGCEATDTRLMGVIALRVTWTGKEDPRARFYQVMHLDFSEYGVDDYYEFEVIPGEPDYREQMGSMRDNWHRFISAMGGTVIDVPCGHMISVLDSARCIAEDRSKRTYDTGENEEFREKTLMRWELMRDSLHRRGQPMDLIGGNDLIAAFSPASLSTCEVINYFIMRLVDLDYEAAGYLSTMDRRKLMQCELTGPGIQTLVRNNIKTASGYDGSGEEEHPYRCRMTTLAENGYYYSSYVICLDRDYRRKNARVTDLRVGSMSRLTEYEAAMQLRQTEYITVFDCRDRILKDFDGSRIEFLNGAEPQPVNNGWLYTVFNSDNSHVNRSEYRLNADVYGYALLTIDGEFILMSNKIKNINYMDECTAISTYAPFMTMDGRYQLDTPIFHDLCRITGVMFRQLIDHTEDF